MSSSNICLGLKDLQAKVSMEGGRIRAEGSQVVPGQAHTLKQPPQHRNPSLGKGKGLRLAMEGKNYHQPCGNGLWRWREGGRCRANFTLLVGLWYLGKGA